MANVLHKTADPVDYRRSVNDPEYDPSSWFINPDVSAVAGVPTKYWKRPLTDPVQEMTQGERDAVDAALQEAARDSTAAGLDGVESYERAFALAVLDEINLHAERVTAILDAIDGASSLAEVKSAIGAIADVPTRTIAQMKTAVRNKLGT